MKTQTFKSKKLALALFVCLISTAAVADQCQLISPEQAGKALDFLKPGGTIVEFCEPCGDKNFYSKPQQIINNIQAVLEQEYWAVKVNGKGIDLAYTFVRNAEGSFLNASKLADCPSDDVSFGFAATSVVK